MQSRTQTEFLYRVTGCRWSVCGSDEDWVRDLVAINSVQEYLYRITIMLFYKIEKSQKHHLKIMHTLFSILRRGLEVLSSIKNSSYKINLLYKL